MTETTQEEKIDIKNGFVSFPEIEGFHNIVKFVKAYNHLYPGPITYRPKPKLHGTNAGVNVEKGQVRAQSRNNFITPQKDNEGFAQWVSFFNSYWSSLPDGVVFGEWCGPGIMKGVAVNQIPSKVFAVFAVRKGDDMIVEPAEIAKHLGKTPEGVYVLPWYADEITVDFDNEVDVRAVPDTINPLVAEVERVDPWVKENFNIEGVGEGLVYYPRVDLTDSEAIPAQLFKHFAFKAKGEKHRVVKTKESVQIAPEVAESISAFVTMFVTPARLEQGLQAIGGVTLPQNVPQFLKWMGEDILKESKAELEVSKLEWGQVQKAVQIAARKWFIDQCKAI